MASQYSVSFHLHQINFLSGTKSCISLLEFFQSGVPTVVQWVKNPTAATRVFVEVVVQSLAWPSGSGSVGHSCGLDSFPGPVTYICYGYIQINTQTIFQLFSETPRVNFEFLAKVSKTIHYLVPAIPFQLLHKSRDQYYHHQHPPKEFISVHVLVSPSELELL